MPCRLLLRSIAIAFVSLAFAACGGKDTKCFLDSNCAQGFRCELPSIRGNAGVCKACDLTETTYDGIDNDCNPRTKDSDLDGDDDNAKTAAIDPGGDCDDNDPEVSSKNFEVCGDGKDNNCDTRVDEPECADRSPPSVTILSPTLGATVAGSILMQAQASDDIGVARVEFLSRGGAAVLATDTSPPYEGTIDTTVLMDGAVDLVARAVDVAGRSTEATVRVQVENHTGPRITIRAPGMNGAYGGFLTFLVDGVDAQGVQRVVLKIDGTSIGTYTSTTVMQRFNTATLPDGPHGFVVEATDVRGAVSTSAPLSFVIDNTGPSVSLRTMNGMTTVQGIVNLTATASDAGGLGSLSLLGMTSMGGSLTVPFDSTSVPNGMYTVTATGTDRAIIDDGARIGNTAVGTIRLNVANSGTTPPMVSLTSPVNGAVVYRTTPITALATAPGGIARIEFLVDHLAIGTDSAPPFSVDYDFGRNVGSVLVEARAYTVRGGLATASATVTVQRPSKFRTPRQIPASDIGDNTYAVGDLTGDGRPDVISCGSASVWLNAGNAQGFYDPPLPVLTVGCLSVRLYDMNQDGRKDIVVLRNRAVQTYIWTPGGYVLAPAYTALLNSSANAKLLDFAVGDLNGDGLQDAVASQSDTSGSDIYVLLNSPAGFLPVVAYGRVGAIRSVEIADIDRDLDLDVVLGRAGAGQEYLTTYINDGLGNFGAGRDSVTGFGSPNFVAVGDITGDSYPDIVAGVAVTNPPGPDQVVVMAGDPSNPGFFALERPTVIGDELVSGISVGDLEGDGTLEAIVSFESANDVMVVRRQSLGMYTVDRYVGIRANHLPKLVDADGDGDMDITLASPEDATIGLIENRGTGRLVASPCTVLARASTSLVAVDVVGDPKPDVVVASINEVSAPPMIQFVETLADHPQALSQTFVTNLYGSPYRIAVGDLGGSSLPDFALVAPAQSNVRTVSMLVSSGTARGSMQFTERHPTTIVPNPYGVAIGDVDGDGTGEVITTFDRLASPSDGIYVLKPDGSAQAQHLGGSAPQDVILGDVDRDNIIDILAANTGSDNVTVLDVPQAGHGALLRTYNALQGAQALRFGWLGPLPRDNIPDLFVLGGRSINRIAALLGSTSNIFESPTPYPAGTGPIRLAVADFNGDSLSDVATLQRNSNLLSIILANPAGGFFPPDVVDTFVSSADLVAADFDGDGKPDIAIVAGGTTYNKPVVTIMYNDY